MSKNEKSGAKVAKTAAKVLSNPRSSPTAKSLAGSALSQANTTKQSSSTAATKAAKALTDGRTAKSTRLLAGSVLTQKDKR